MQYIQATIYLMLTSCFMMTSVQAHDPSEHVKTNEAPKCESMKAMDHSKMDANDPIMMAMMKKCKAQAQKEAMQMDHSNDAKWTTAIWKWTTAIWTIAVWKACPKVQQVGTISITK